MAGAMWHLLYRAITASIHSMGTTFVAVIVGLMVFGIKRIFESKVARDARWGLGATVGAWCLLVLWSAMGIVYGEHRAFQGLRDKTMADHITFANPQWPAFVNSVMSFMPLVHPQYYVDSANPCQMKITAPKENRDIAETLAQLASAVGCNVQPLGNLDLDPDVGSEAAKDAVPNVILIHMRRNPTIDLAPTGLENVFSIRRSYDVPVGSPANFVWLQIGTGDV
jgi:hypothetical protein